MDLILSSLWCSQDSEAVLRVCAAAGFLRGAALVQHLRGEYQGALRSYLQLPDDTAAAFSYVHR